VVRDIPRVGENRVVLEVARVHTHQHFINLYGASLAQSAQDETEAVVKATKEMTSNSFKSNKEVL
jgi:hypothetical protein